MLLLPNPGFPSAHLALEVEQPQSFEFNGCFGPQVSSQGARKVFQLLDAVGDAGLEPVEEGK